MAVERERDELAWLKEGSIRTHPEHDQHSGKDGRCSATEVYQCSSKLTGPKVWVGFRGEPDLGAARVAEVNIETQTSWTLVSSH